jgi:hypothetical protein
MRIAVCIFGQPRFYKQTAESFKKEFYDFPGHDVDVFIHSWSDVGNTPDDDWNNCNKKNNLQALKDSIWNNYENTNGKSVLSMVVEDPEETFGPICDSLAHVLQTVRYDKWLDDTQNDWRKHLGKIKIKTAYSDSDKTSIRIDNGRVLRYEMGQLYSMGKAIELKSWHEKENNIKYDVVVKVRTDAVFIPEELYDNKEDYYKAKEDYYLQGIKDNKRGIYGYGLNLIMGLGNGWTVAGGKADTGMIVGVDAVETKDGNIINIESHEKKFPYVNLYRDIILDDSGMFNFPFKIHHKDWLMFADSDSADLAWSTMISTYISFVARDISRFMGKKELPYMPGGEVLHAGSALFNGVNMYYVKGKIKPSDNDYIKLFKHKRVFKVVHPDVDKRKGPFRFTDEETQLRNGFIAVDTPKNMLKNLLKIKNYTVK